MDNSLGITNWSCLTSNSSFSKINKCSHFSYLIRDFYVQKWPNVSSILSLLCCFVINDHLYFDLTEFVCDDQRIWLHGRWFWEKNLSFEKYEGNHFSIFLSILSQLASATLDLKVGLKIPVSRCHLFTSLNHPKCEGELGGSVPTIAGRHITECQGY